MSTLTHGTSSFTGANTQTTQTQTYTFSTAQTYVDKNIAFTVTAKSATANLSGGDVTANNATSAVGTNITLTNSNTSGIYFTTTGTATITRASVTNNVTSSGWVTSSSTLTATTTTATGSSTYYVNKVTIAKPSSGTYNFTVNTPNGGTATDFLISVDSSGNVWVS